MDSPRQHWKQILGYSLNVLCADARHKSRSVLAFPCEDSIIGEFPPVGRAFDGLSTVQLREFGHFGDLRKVRDTLAAE